jgi:hypothetical protein
VDWREIITQEQQGMTAWAAVAPTMTAGEAVTPWTSLELSFELLTNIKRHRQRLAPLLRSYAVIYVTRPNGEVVGKFSEAEFHGKIASGDISPNDQYLSEDAGGTWKKASEFPGATFPAAKHGMPVASPGLPPARPTKSPPLPRTGSAPPQRIVYVARNGEVIAEHTEAEFRKRVANGTIPGTDHYFCEGFTDWKLVEHFKHPSKRPLTDPSQIGGLLVLSWFAPLLSPALILATIVITIAAFVIAIMTIVKGRAAAGMFLFAGCIFSPFITLAIISARH